MDKKGYNFLTQDRLRKLCEEENINLMDQVPCPDVLLSHDQLISAINYCSLGDYDLSLKCVRETQKVLNLCSWLPYHMVISANIFIHHFWRNSFIQTRFNLECGGSFDIDNMRSLSFVYQTIREFEQNQDITAIQNYLAEMNFQHMEESMRILAEYTIVKC